MWYYHQINVILPCLGINVYIFPGCLMPYQSSNLIWRSDSFVYFSRSTQTLQKNANLAGAQATRISYDIWEINSKVWGNGLVVKQVAFDLRLWGSIPAILLRSNWWVRLPHSIPSCPVLPDVQEIVGCPLQAACPTSVGVSPNAAAKTITFRERWLGTRQR